MFAAERSLFGKKIEGKTRINGKNKESIARYKNALKKEMDEA